MKQVAHVDLRDDGVLGEPGDGKSAEDASKDDMFVDCPDELITFDGKQKEEEAVAAENEDDKPEENQVLHRQQSHLVELGNGVGGDGSPTGQLEQLRLTVAEKESVVKEYQVCGL